MATVSETAAVSGNSQSQVYLMIQRGDLPAHREGRSVRVPWSVLRLRYLQPVDAMQASQ
jgi:excisionase family DNA binding protein